MQALVNTRGLCLVRLHEIEESGLDGARSPTHALVIARTRAGFLLVYNRRLSAWELPGGLIERGESAREAAAREFEEETGLAAPRLRWRGVIELARTGVQAAPEFGALFCADVTAASVKPFNSEEIAGVGLWPLDGLPAPTCAVDFELLKLFQ